jgi:hypothetical protein
MYAIVRNKAAKNAWFWAVHFKRAGKLYYRCFYDLKHGGENLALRAAIIWRDARLKKVPVLTVRQFHARKRSNNTSSATGVHLVRSALQPDGAWQAMIKLPDGRRPSKSFSIRKYGNAKAFALAKKARKAMLELIDAGPYLKHPTAKTMARRASRPPPAAS